MKNYIRNLAINYKLEHNRYPALVEVDMSLDGFNNVIIYNSTINYINYNIKKRL